MSIQIRRRINFRERLNNSRKKRAFFNKNDNDNSENNQINEKEEKNKINKEKNNIIRNDYSRDKKSPLK